jgi:hypothetical protein
MWRLDRATEAESIPMEFKDILAMVGVVIGWFLKELSDALRNRAEVRSTVGPTLVGLLQLESELHRLGLVLMFQKSRPISWEQYEAIRQATAKRYIARTPPHQMVEAATNALARVDPVEAAYLRELPTTLDLFHNTSLAPLAETDRHHADYVKALSVLEVSVEITEKLLRKIILRMARLHGPLTWLRIRLSWRSRRSKLAAKNQQAVERLLNEFFAAAAPPSKSPSDSPRSAGDPPPNPSQRTPPG